MKHSQKKPNNQAKVQKSSQKPRRYRPPKYLDCSIMNDPEHFFSGMNESELQVLDYLINVWSWNKRIEPSHKRIADEVGLSDRHVRRILDKLYEHGLINWWYRHRHTSLYNIAYYFFNERVKSRLKSYLPSLLKLPFSIVMLLSIMGGPENTDLKGIMYRNVLPIYNDISLLLNLPKKEKKIHDLGDRRVGVPFEGEIHPEILSQDSQKTGARLMLGASPSRCCSMCMVLGVNLCNSGAKPVLHKGKADAPPAARSRVPAESRQAKREPWRPSSSLAGRDVFERSAKNRASAIERFTVEEKIRHDGNFNRFWKILEGRCDA